VLYLCAPVNFDRGVLLYAISQCDQEFVGEKEVCVPGNLPAVMTSTFGPYYLVPDVSSKFCWLNIKNGVAPAIVYCILLVGLMMLLAGLSFRLQWHTFLVACALLSVSISFAVIIS
jgi:hypothetical protein